MKSGEKCVIIFTDVSGVLRDGVRVTRGGAEREGQMEFDFVKTAAPSDEPTAEYGIIDGNGQVVIIKAGAGGSYVGAEERYLKLSRMLHEAKGCTVICFSNLHSDSFEQADAAVIRDVLAGIEGEKTLYYIGNSNGSTQGLLVAARQFAFARMVLVNMPLMCNFHKIQHALTCVGTEVIFVYGENDPSYSYIPFLRHTCQKETCTARVKIETVPQADHNFKGMTDAFLACGMRVLEG